jgi:hypothetical protein
VQSQRRIPVWLHAAGGLAIAAIAAGVAYAVGIGLTYFSRIGV